MKPLFFLLVSAFLSQIAFSQQNPVHNISSIEKYRFQPDTWAMPEFNEGNVDDNGNYRTTIPITSISYPSGIGTTVEISYNSAVKYADQSGSFGFGWDYNPASINRTIMSNNSFENPLDQEYYKNIKEAVDYPVLIDNDYNWDGARDIYSIKLPDGNGFQFVVQKNSTGYKLNKSLIDEKSILDSIAYFSDFARNDATIGYHQFIPLNMSNYFIAGYYVKNNSVNTNIYSNKIITNQDYFAFLVVDPSGNKYLYQSTLVDYHLHPELANANNQSPSVTPYCTFYTAWRISAISSAKDSDLMIDKNVVSINNRPQFVLNADSKIIYTYTARVNIGNSEFSSVHIKERNYLESIANDYKRLQFSYTFNNLERSASNSIPDNNGGDLLGNYYFESSGIINKIDIQTKQKTSPILSFVNVDSYLFSYRLQHGHSFLVRIKHGEHNGSYDFAYKLDSVSSSTHNDFEFIPKYYFGFGGRFPEMNKNLNDSPEFFSLLSHPSLPSSYLPFNLNGYYKDPSYGQLNKITFPSGKVNTLNYEIIDVRRTPFTSEEEMLTKLPHIVVNNPPELIAIGWPATQIIPDTLKYQDGIWALSSADSIKYFYSEFKNIQTKYHKQDWYYGNYRMYNRLKFYYSRLKEIITVNDNESTGKNYKLTFQYSFPFFSGIPENYWVSSKDSIERNGVLSSLGDQVNYGIKFNIQRNMDNAVHYEYVSSLKTYNNSQTGLETTKYYNFYNQDYFLVLNKNQVWNSLISDIYVSNIDILNSISRQYWYDQDTKYRIYSTSKTRIQKDNFTHFSTLYTISDAHNYTGSSLFSPLVYTYADNTVVETNEEKGYPINQSLKTEFTYDRGFLSSEISTSHYNTNGDHVYNTTSYKYTKDYTGYSNLRSKFQLNLPVLKTIGEKIYVKPTQPTALTTLPVEFNYMKALNSDQKGMIILSRIGKISVDSLKFLTLTTTQKVTYELLDPKILITVFGFNEPDEMFLDSSIFDDVTKYEHCNNIYKYKYHYEDFDSDSDCGVVDSRNYTKTLNFATFYGFSYSLANKVISEFFHFQSSLTLTNYVNQYQSTPIAYIVDEFEVLKNEPMFVKKYEMNHYSSSGNYFSVDSYINIGRNPDLSFIPNIMSPNETPDEQTEEDWLKTSSSSFQNGFVTGVLQGTQSVSFSYSNNFEDEGVFDYDKPTKISFYASGVNSGIDLYAKYDSKSRLVSFGNANVAFLDSIGYDSDNRPVKIFRGSKLTKSLKHNLANDFNTATNVRSYLSSLNRNFIKSVIYQTDTDSSISSIYSDGFSQIQSNTSDFITSYISDMVFDDYNRVAGATFNIDTTYQSNYLNNITSSYLKPWATISNGNTSLWSQYKVKTPFSSSNSDFSGNIKNIFNEDYSLKIKGRNKIEWTSGTFNRVYKNYIDENNSYKIEEFLTNGLKISENQYQINSISTYLAMNKYTEPIPLQIESPTVLTLKQYIPHNLTFYVTLADGGGENVIRVDTIRTPGTHYFPIDSPGLHWLSVTTPESHSKLIYLDLNYNSGIAMNPTNHSKLLFNPLDGYSQIEKEDAHSTINYTYDEYDRLIEIKHPDGTKTKYRYDNLDQIVKKETPDHYFLKQNSTFDESDVDNNADFIYAYDSYGRLLFSSDPNQMNSNKMNYFVYDGFGRLVEKGTMLIDYSLFDGRVLQVSSQITSGVQNEWTEKYTYDSAGNFSGFEIKNCKGLLSKKEEKVSMSSSTSPLITTFYSYTPEGYLSQVKEINPFFTKEEFYSNYDLQGKLIRYKMMVNVDTIVSRWISYNGFGQLGNVYQAMNGIKPDNPIVSYSYNPDGSVKNETYSGNLQKIDYEYNIRGWLTSINNPDSLNSNGDLYGQRLSYWDNLPSGISPNYNGNISYTEHANTNTATKLQAGYLYDSFNRLTDSKTFGSNTDYYNTSYSYDVMGNILSNKKWGRKNGTVTSLMDDLTYQYAGNKLMNVNDVVSSTDFDKDYDTKPVSSLNNYRVVFTEDFEGYSTGNYTTVNEKWPIIALGYASDYKITAAGLPSGSKSLIISNNAPVEYQIISKLIEIIPGITYKLSAYLSQYGGWPENTTGVKLEWLSSTQSIIGFPLLVLPDEFEGMNQSVVGLAPIGAVYARISLNMQLHNNPMQYLYFDDIKLEEKSQFEYDANGNTVQDMNRDISQITYNQMNLPVKVAKINGSVIEYGYNQSGQRLWKKQNGVYTNIYVRNLSGATVGEMIDTGTDSNIKTSGNTSVQATQLNIVTAPTSTTSLLVTQNGSTTTIPINSSINLMNTSNGNYNISLKPNGTGSVKLTTLSAQNSNVAYLSYVNLEGSSVIGRTQRENGADKQYFYLKDHLGNIRTTAKDLRSKSLFFDDFESYPPLNGVRPVSNGNWQATGVNSESSSVASVINDAQAGKVLTLTPTLVITTATMKSKSMNAQATKDYFFKVRLKSGNPSLLIDVIAVFLNSGGGITSTQYIASGVHPNSWTSYSLKATAPSVTVSCQIRLFAHGSSGKVGYFDDISVSELQTSGESEAKIVSTQDYYPFGSTLRESVSSGSSAEANKFKFIGKELDAESQLYDFGPRLYDKDLGIFRQVDPMREQFNGWNPYHYSFNNPIRYHDPSGLAPNDPNDPDDKNKTGYIQGLQSGNLQKPQNGSDKAEILQKANEKASEAPTKAKAEYDNMSGALGAVAVAALASTPATSAVGFAVAEIASLGSIAANGMSLALSAVDVAVNGGSPAKTEEIVGKTGEIAADVALGAGASYATKNLAKEGVNGLYYSIGRSGAMSTQEGIQRRVVIETAAAAASPVFGAIVSTVYDWMK